MSLDNSDTPQASYSPHTPSDLSWMDSPSTADAYSSPCSSTSGRLYGRQTQVDSSSLLWNAQDPFVIPEVEYEGVLAGEWNPCTGGLCIGKYLESIDTPSSYRSLAFRWEQLGRPHLQHIRIPLDLLQESSGVLGFGKDIRKDLSAIADAQEAMLINKLGSAIDNMNDVNASAQLFVGFASYLDVYCSVNSELTVLEQDSHADEQSSLYQDTCHRFLRQIEQHRVNCALSPPHRCLVYLLWGEVYTWSLEEKLSRFGAYKSPSRERHLSSGSTVDQDLALSPSLISVSAISSSIHVPFGLEAPTSVMSSRRSSEDLAISGIQFGDQVKVCDDKTASQRLHLHSKVECCTSSRLKHCSDHLENLELSQDSPTVHRGRGDSVISAVFPSSPIGNSHHFTREESTSSDSQLRPLNLVDQWSRGVLNSVDVAQTGRRLQTTSSRPLLTRSHTTDMILELPRTPHSKRKYIEDWDCSPIHVSHGSERFPLCFNATSSSKGLSGHRRIRAKLLSDLKHQSLLMERYEEMLDNAVRRLDAATVLLQAKALNGRCSHS